MDATIGAVLMNPWIVETHDGRPILTHYCNSLRSGDGCAVLRADISGGYSCERCGEKYFSATSPYLPDITLRLREAFQLPIAA